MSAKFPKHPGVASSECSLCNKSISNEDCHLTLSLNDGIFKWIAICKQCYRKKINVKTMNRLRKNAIKHQRVIIKKDTVVRKQKEDIFFVKCDCCKSEYKIKDYKKIAKFVKEFPASYLIKNYKIFLDGSVVEDFAQRVESIAKFYNKKLCNSCYRKQMLKQTIVESQIRKSKGFKHEKSVVQSSYIGNLYRTQKYDAVLSSIDDE